MAIVLYFEKKMYCRNLDKVNKFTYFTYPTLSMNSSSVWMLPLVCEYLTAFSDEDDLFSASTHLSRSPLSRDFLWLFFVVEVWGTGAVWCTIPFEIPTSTEDGPPAKTFSYQNMSLITSEKTSVHHILSTAYSQVQRRGKVAYWNVATSTRHLNHQFMTLKVN